MLSQEIQIDMFVNQINSTKNYEILNECDDIIGKYYCDGQYIDTNKSVIHYGKKNAHIVPIKGDNYG